MSLGIESIVCPVDVIIATELEINGPHIFTAIDRPSVSPPNQPTAASALCKEKLKGWYLHTDRCCKTETQKKKKKRETVAKMGEKKQIITLFACPKSNVDIPNLQPRRTSINRLLRLCRRE